MIFLRSYRVHAVSAAVNAVQTPKTMISKRIFSLHSKIKEQRIIKKIPAVTIVAAWINAETGVGPSIAAGSQVCKPICADLPIIPINKKKQITSTVNTLTI